MEPIAILAIVPSAAAPIAAPASNRHHSSSHYTDRGIRSPPPFCELGWPLNREIGDRGD